MYTCVKYCGKLIGKEEKTGGDHMDQVLYDICKDAIAKSASASDEDRRLLVEAAANALMLAAKARREGLLALEKAAAAAPFTPDYLKQIIALIVDGRDPQMVLEIAANGYWNQNPQGIHAMVRYFYIRSMLLAQNGEDTHLIEDLFVSLVPDKWREGFLEQAALDKEKFEQERQKDTTAIFFRIHPSFQNAELLDRLHTLEEKVLALSDGAVQTLLRNTSMNTLAVCLYAFQDAVRKKILHNISSMRSGMLMQDVVWRGAIAQEEIWEALKTVDALLGCLRDSGEIAG